MVTSVNSLREAVLISVKVKPDMWEETGQV